MRLISRFAIVLPVLSLMLTLPTTSRAQAADAQVQADVQKALDKSAYRDVHVAVNGGVVTLTGEVSKYADKLEAEKKIHHRKGVDSVQNRIQVAAEGVSDAELQAKLSKALTYDRVGYGTTVFNNITLQVNNGVVTIGGTVYGPPDKDSALGLIADTKGVRDVVDNLQVAPVSPNDDRIRRAEAQAIYGYTALNRYALDPAKTIRITVVNGHVTLNGVVDTKGDRDIAGIRANGVPGVFSVVNNLQVAGEQSGQR